MRFDLPEQSMSTDSEKCQTHRKNTLLKDRNSNKNLLKNQNTNNNNSAQLSTNNSQNILLATDDIKQPSKITQQTTNQENYCENNGDINIYLNTFENSVVFNKNEHTSIKNKNITKIKSCKILNIGTYNVLTLFQCGKLHQLTNGCAEVDSGIDFLAIQEHRWFTDDSNELEQKWCHNGKFLLVYASADKPMRTRGVGMLINGKHISCIKSMQKISSRIMSVTLNGNPDMNIICAYAPTDTSQIIDKNNFYEDLHNYISRLPPHNVIIIAGDFNSRIGFDKYLEYPIIIIGSNTYYQNSTYMVKNWSVCVLHWI